MSWNLQFPRSYELNWIELVPQEQKQTSFDAVRILFVNKAAHYTIAGKPRDAGVGPLCLCPPLSPSFFTPQQPSFSTSCLNIV